MDTRELLISVLMLGWILLSACAPVAMATQPAITAVPPTDAATLPTQLASDQTALVTVVGNYSYITVGRRYNFILNVDGTYNSLASFGTFTVTADQITFMESNLDCASQLGVYKWSLDGNTLQLTSIKDDCLRREALFGSQEFEKDQAALPNDPKSLALITGNYLYQDGAETFQFNLFSNESFIRLRNSSDGFVAGSGAIGVTADQITFVEYGGLCKSQPGLYNWSLDNNILNLTLIKDDCKHRVDIFESRVFERVPENNMNATVIWEIPASVYGIATDLLGNIYVTEGGAIFSKYDIHGKLLGSWIQGLSFTTGIAVDHEGNIYVANFDPPEIHKFLPDGTPLLTWAIADGVGPDGLAVDLHGNVYVALHRLHDHYIEKYDPQGKLLSTWAEPATASGQIVAGSRSGPGLLVVDANGNNYITDAGKKIHKYDQDGKFLYDIPVVGGITIDTQGNLYVFVSDENIIIEFDSNGKQIGKWFAPKLGVTPGFTYGIAMDKDGNIFIHSDTVLVKIKLPKQ